MRTALSALVAVAALTTCLGGATRAPSGSVTAVTEVAASVPAAWAHDQLGLVVTEAAPAAPRTGPVVAVLDTGVAPVSDLAGALVPGFDAFGGGETSDENGHGTAVAALIAGAHDGQGADGVCPTCRIMPLKIAGAEGRAPDLAQAAAINWAVEHGATLLSISFVGAQPGGPLADAVAGAVARGVTIVAAAGNEATGDRRWPAAYDAVVGVGASDESGGLAGFSNRGSGWVDLLAPACASSMSPQQQTVLFCGTSVSTPLTSGAIALLKSLSPATSYAEIVSVLERTAAPVGGDVAGFGRLDVGAAMQVLGVGQQPAASAAAPVTERSVRTLASRGKAKSGRLRMRAV